MTFQHQISFFENEECSYLRLNQDEIRMLESPEAEVMIELEYSPNFNALSGKFPNGKVAWMLNFLVSSRVALPLSNPIASI